MKDNKAEQFREYLKIKKAIDEDKSEEMIDNFLVQELEQKDKDDRSI